MAKFHWIGICKDGLTSLDHVWIYFGSDCDLVLKDFADVYRLDDHSLDRELSPLTTNIGRIPSFIRANSYAPGIWVYLLALGSLEPLGSVW